jgi:hypothetical protein
MSGPDASWYDMPGSLSPGWLRREPDETLLDMIVAGLPLPDDAPQHVIALASGLAELAGSAGPGELTGEAGVLAAFSAAVSPVGVSGARVSGAGTSERTPARHRSRRPAAVRARLAAAITFAGIVVSGTAAAYAGVLPGPVQELAHKIIGAPAAHEHNSHGPAGSQHAGGRHTSGRGHHGAQSASRGKGSHGKAAGGKAVHGKKVRGKSTKGKAKGHTRPKHPAPKPSPTVPVKPPGHGHHMRG